jgi:putative transposase
LRALHQAESGIRVADIYREHGISEATYYIWKKKYSGLGLSELRELRQLREENAKLKCLVADLSTDRHILQEMCKKAVKPRQKRELGHWTQTVFALSARRG